jgi:hypothetical protein
VISDKIDHVDLTHAGQAYIVLVWREQVSLQRGRQETELMLRKMQSMKHLYC